jgi:hypothetical protein
MIEGTKPLPYLSLVSKIKLKTGSYENKNAIGLDVTVIKNGNE